MKRFAAIAAVAAALLAGGCTTVKYSDRGGKSMVEVTNHGWYLLNFIPLASGNPDAPNEMDFRLFRQTTTLANNMRMLDHAATERNATCIQNVMSSTDDESIFIILLKRHTIHTSAELIIAKEAAE